MASSTFLKSILLGVALISVTTGMSHAQRQFVNVTGIPPLIDGAHAGADFDGDGDEDVFVTGRHQDGTLHTVLYEFLRRRVVFVTPLAPPTVYADYRQVTFLKTSVMKGSVTWHDMNRDGRPDLIVTGQTVGAFNPDNSEVLIPTTTVYLNNPITFNIVPNTGLPGLYNSKVEAGDFNGDGVEDLVMGGLSTNGLVLGVWLGNSQNVAGFTPGPTQFESLQVSSLSVADIDSDNDLDFVVSGLDSSGLAHLRVYENDGNANFTEVPTSLPNLYFGGTALGDVDFDGDVDLLVNGGRLDPVFMRGETKLYLNDGTGHFTEAPSSLTGLYGGGVSLVDLDGDRDADVFSWGVESLSLVGSEKITVAENIDTYLLPIGSAASVIRGSVAWFDYDGNGRKDAFVSGLRAGARSMFIWEF